VNHIDVLLALDDLGNRTPEYLRGEMFAHADLTALEDAKEILTEGIDPSEAVRAMKRLLKTV